MVKLSNAQRRMLDNINRGASPTAHCKTRSDHGGADGTLRSLVRRGLLTREHALTDAGRDAIAGQRGAP